MLMKMMVLKVLQKLSVGRGTYMHVGRQVHGYLSSSRDYACTCVSARGLLMNDRNKEEWPELQAYKRWTRNQINHQQDDDSPS